MIALWAIAVIAALALAPSAFAETQAGWQFNEAARRLDGVAYETLTALVTGVRLALTGLMLATAALLLTRRAPGAGLAALALTTLPFTFNLAGSGVASGYPSLLAGLLRAVALALGLVGIVALLLLLFLFPDGRVYPPRLRRPVLVGLALILGGLLLIQFVDNVWFFFMLFLAAFVLLGMLAQVLRYRSAGAGQRRQTIGVLAVWLALPLWAVMSAAGSAPVLILAAGYALLALLPAGLLLGLARGLWGGVAGGRRTSLFAAAVGATLVAVILAAAWWWTANRPLPVSADALAAVAPVPIVLDSDMAMDDLGAVLFLLQHPAVDLRAITVNGVAFAHCDGGVRAALGLLEVARAPQVPVACGREEAFPGGTPAPDAWRKSADDLYGAQVTTGQRQADDRPAARLLAETVAAAPGQIVVVAIGPLTNLAEAFQADPALAGQIKQIVIMGGALDAAGNVANEQEGITNEYAEWNFFADPQAADIVLSSGAPILLVPLDATNDVPFTLSFYRRLGAAHATRPATFVYNLLYLNQGWFYEGMYWWDTLTASAALDDGLLTLRDERVDVITDAGDETARLVRAADGAPVRLAVAADRAHFEALFLAALNYPRGAE